MAERALVIIPTYNERDNLPRIIPLVLAQDPRLHVLVVDDHREIRDHAAAKVSKAKEKLIHSQFIRPLLATKGRS